MEEDRQRPAIRNRVVQDDPKCVIILIEANQDRPEQRAFCQIEGPLGILTENLLGPAFAVFAWHA